MKTSDFYLKKPNSNSKFLKQKRQARKLCVEGLYQYGYNQVKPEDLFNLSWFLSRNRPALETQEYYLFLIQGTLDHLKEIDAHIQEFANKISDNRMMPIDKAILRLGVFSLIFEKNLDNVIIINEAIEISKYYSGVNAHKFINGVLDGISKKLVKNHTAKDGEVDSSL